MVPDRLRTTFQLALEAGSGGAEALKALCVHLGLPFFDRLPTPRVPSELTEKFDVAWARKNRLVPLSVQDDHVVAATSVPLAVEPPDQLAFVLGRRVELVGAPEDEILRALNMYFSESMASADDVLKEMTETEVEVLGTDLEAVPDLIDSSDSAPVIRLINRVLFQAVSEKASDIHIEPASDHVKVRFRIDGVLYDRLHPPLQYLPFLSSRIKVLAGLDIAEKRLPQDGRFQFTVAELNIDVRVSIIPTAGGERVVLRLLDKSTALLGLEELGMDPDNFGVFNQLITRPHGIFLATGPTGAGKTTTLYAALSRLNSRELNIITIEDPVEYRLSGVGQIHVNTKVGLDFARGLRSVLRHDPDVIMIGEIRDFETAEIAIQAALTGHLVFSTLHTNDASSAVTRLVDMGVEPFLVSSAVIGVGAQRLVRLLCPHCRQPHRPLARTLSRAGLPQDVLDGAEVYQPAGCEHCFQTGYRGRTGIYELLAMTGPVQRTLARTSESNEIRQSAIESGMKPLIMDGLNKVRAGKTSLEEVLRVTLT
ncbi:MAG: type II secretion system ATPase GspE [Proteobacteria bacterium]|nr:type II secretion system ATPase GspE [Pseudomonadota bacterium]